MKSDSEGMDSLDKRFLIQSIIPMLFIVLLTTLFFLRFGQSGIILAGSLALTFFVVADIAWSRHSSTTSH